MSKRILVLVQRSGGGTHITDATPTIVFEHEVPLLEEIHGEGSCITMTDEELLDRDVVVKRKQQIDYIIRANRLGEGFNGDPFEEYQRLAAKYGMHPEVRMLVVEKVYGVFREGRFTKACGVLAYEEMSLAELRKICDDIGITLAPSHKKGDVIAFIRDANANAGNIQIDEEAA
jgi:hypothetical protein